MIVGFTITDFKGHEKEAVSFIQEVCVLDSPEIAQNIVNAGVEVNIFSSAINADLLKAQPFSCSPIEIKEGKYLLVSAVNFNLELLYNGSILRLVPTEYIYISPEEVAQFSEYLAQKLVKLIPEVNDSLDGWILEDGSWDDTGIWVDSNFWKDE